MDEQLKRRLMGVTIIVVLSVIFVPMLFEDESDKAAAGVTAEVPTLPETIESHTIELPKSAADVVSEEKTGAKDNKKEADTGFRVIPLDDAPPKPAKAEPPPPAPSVAVPVEDTEVPVEEDVEAGGEESPPPIKPEPKGAVPVVKDAHKQAFVPKGKDIPGKKAKPGAEPSQPERTVKKPAVEQPEPEDVAPAEDPEFAAEPVPTAKAPESPVKKPEKAKLVVVPKPVPPKPAPIIANPKPVSTPPAVRNTEPAPAKPIPVKPAPSRPPTLPKPAEAAPAASAPPVAAKPQEPKRPAAPEAAAPTSWTVQAGSFTAETNARGLADKLRKASLPANVQVSQGQSGPVYRVTIGAGASRAQAEQIQKQIENAVGIRALIQPHR